MKTRFLFALVLTACLGVLTAADAPAQGTQPAPSPEAPTPPVHIPYRPPARPAATLPEYPYNGLHRVEARPAGGGLPKPPGVDLDVTTISREPLYNPYEVWYTPEMKPYLRPGTEELQRWPALGEIVTFTAHVMNKGTLASPPFDFSWLIDGVKAASGEHMGSLAPGEETTVIFRWPWGHALDGDRLLGEHTVRFTVDPAGLIPETCRSNNSLEDRTDAISLWLVVTPELYAALEVPVKPTLPFSAEDWLQKQIAAMNAAFARSVYPSTPDGIVERVRLDRVIVTCTPPDRDGVDGGFFISVDDRQPGYAYYDPETDVSGYLIHELSHQLGVIDLYNFGFNFATPQVVDAHGWPVEMETSLPLTGLMIYPDVRYYEEHSAHGLNLNKGYRRGYYGEYLFDLPLQTRLRVLDNQGQPAAGVTVRLFQSAWGRPGTTIDNFPEHTAVTDADGTIALVNRPVGAPATTRTGHTLRDNPFGIVDILGENDEFIVELVKGPHAEYGWLHILPFNLAAWTGMTEAATLDIPSHVPPAGAPAPPDLAAIVERSWVTLRWPGSAIPEVAGYNLYRSWRNPAFEYRRIVEGTKALTYADYCDHQWSATYAVTAVDLDGRESGFSPLFNAFCLINPTGVVLDEMGRRIVLDPQGGYALFLQKPDGRVYDMLGSVGSHLEFSRFLARDPDGRLILSHPGDVDSTRHSVRVLDAEGYPLFDFGERGSGPGQFDGPAGVAVWDGLCTAEGLLAPDGHPLLRAGNSDVCRRILVADSGNNRIQAFDAQGNFLTAYGETGNGRRQFNNPQGIAVMADGRVIVADTGNNRLHLLSYDGQTFNFIRLIEAGLKAPIGVASYRNTVIVADTGNDVVKAMVVDGDIHLVTLFPGPNDEYSGPFNAPQGVIADTMGNIVVADTGNGRVATIRGAFPRPKVLTWLPLVVR
jgi:hypothetical protein